MSRKLTKFNGQETVFFRWQTREPKSGDHVTAYTGEDDGSGRQKRKRLILQEQVHCQPWGTDPNMTEEWWSFIEVSESEFQRIGTEKNKSKIISNTHNSLFE